MGLEGLVEVRPGFGGFDFPYESAKVVLIGVPLDVTASYRPGYRFAPAKIREASANLETYLMSTGVDVLERLNISDLGDIVVTPTDLKHTGERITNIVKRVSDDGKIPALIGGEHTITYFALKAFSDIFVIHLDAHRDLREEYLGDRLCHATVMRRVLDTLPPEKLIQVGVRSCSKEEDEFARDVGLTAYTPKQVMDEPKRVISGIKKIVGSSHVYLTIDIDVLDPAFAPGVSTPEPGGLTTSGLLQFIREIGKLNISAFDVVELVPPHDDGITAFAAAKIIYELLAVLPIPK